MRRAAKIDALHPEVRALFRAHGCTWEDTASVGGGFPDALTIFGPASIFGRMALIEVKSGARAITRQKYGKDAKTAARQAAFAARFPVWRISDLQQAADCIQWLKTGDGK